MTGFDEFSNRLLQDRPVVCREVIPWRWGRRSTAQYPALFAVLHDAELSRIDVVRCRHYNWGHDALWAAPDGTGLLVAEECFGALPGDGIDVHVHLLLPGDVHVTFAIGTDYTQPNLKITASGYSEDAVDAALQATASVVRTWRKRT